MALSRFSSSTLSKGFPKSQSFAGFGKGYVGERLDGGSNFIAYDNTVNNFSNFSDTSLTRAASGTIWNNLCSNQGTYFGGIQTTSGGGTGQFKSKNLNGGLPLPVGTYSFSTSIYLDLNNQNTSHDGIYMWLVTPTKKYYFGFANHGLSPRDTQFTFNADNITTTAEETAFVEYTCVDGSSAWAMGIRTFWLSLTRV